MSARSKHIAWLATTALLAALAAFPTTSTAETRWVTVQLTRNISDDLINSPGRPLSNGCAAWHTEPTHDEVAWEIVLLRLEPGVLPDQGDGKVIMNHGAYVSVNDSCQAVWQGTNLRPGIYLYDGTYSPIPTENQWAMVARINNLGHVAWVGVPADAEIFEVSLFDGVTVERLTHNEAWDSRPQIADNGHIAWTTRAVDSSDTEIVVYQDSPDPPAMTDNSFDDDSHRINSSGRVVWVSHEDPERGTVMLFDGAGTEAIYSGGATDRRHDPKTPRINDNGHVVWHAMGNDSVNIWLYDATSGLREFPTPTLHDLYPTINNHQHIAWIGYSGGDPLYRLSHGAVYLHDGTRFHQLSDRGIWARGVEINDVGHVLWEQFDGNDWEIMLAVRVEVPEVEWASTYGGDQWDAATDVIETADRAYLVAGSTRSFGAVEADAWMVKLGPQGAVEWERRYGGPVNDVAACVHEVDGGYILAGTTASFGAGSTDAWLVKTNESGIVQWERAYGGAEKEEVACVEVLDDGSGDIVFAATSWSFESGGVPEFPYSHLWLVKVDEDTGDIVWQKLYAQSPYDRAWSVEQTTDGGFVVGGTTYAPGLGNSDFWVLKLDEDGAVEWQKAFGQNEWVPADPWFHYSEWNAYVRQAADGGYMVAGTSTSNNTWVQAAWVLKLDAEGAIEWEHWGGIPYVTDLLPPDLNGEYQVLGRTGSPVRSYPSFLDNLTESTRVAAAATKDVVIISPPSRPERPRQAQLMMGDPDPGLVTTTYVRDPALHDELAAIAPTWDGGYVVAGGTSAHWSDLTPGDAWVLKLDTRGRMAAECEAVKSDDEAVILPGSTNPMTVATTATVTDTDTVPTWTGATAEDTELTAGEGCRVIQPDLIDLAATGQTTTYLPGDDGDLQAGVAWPNPRFVDNGDGTMRDRLTGLVWLKDGGCMESSGYDDWAGTWYEVFAFVDALNAGEVYAGACDYWGGHDDWRVPNLIEMGSLVNLEVEGALTWLDAYGFINVCGAYGAFGYWTSTSRGGSGAWRVDADGVFGSRFKDDYHVAGIWPVREGQAGAPDPSYPANLPTTGQTWDDPDVTGDDGELRMGVAWPAPRFFDNGDGTVLDGLTGLTWLKNVNCFGMWLGWPGAIAAVDNLNANPGAYAGCGYTGDADDWHLPNRRELLSLLQFRYNDWSLPLLDGHPFYGFSPEFGHWSSTTYAADPTKAWALYLSTTGGFQIDPKGSSYGHAAWPVRGTTSMALFADGFESGDTDEWSATVE